MIDIYHAVCPSRCLHITDIGLGYIATMGQLNFLSLRWCPQIRDFGLQTLCSMKSLKVLSLAGKKHDILIHINGRFITHKYYTLHISKPTCNKILPLTLFIPLRLSSTQHKWSFLSSPNAATDRTRVN